MNLALDDYISIYIHQSDLIFTSYIKSKLAPFNLAPEQNLIMMLLWKQDGLSQNEVAEKLDKDKTNIARMSQGLEQKGFIDRVNCAKDRRIQRLYLTEAGRQLSQQIIPIAESFHETLCKNISEEELRQLRNILSRMRENLNKPS
ncbi:MarR family transcriptional regulator [Bacillus sp. SA1-12]|uniref:MarR family winged helix-turn-helix transcriptional regulator n=1 Tax=Bacillus sp. SA1-12 TaxID=1455638 RepID=UPI000625C93A|nr:MarR family transcriptional regulator [Bacillus sp. SA1-12]KKI93584.1 MarR family transcriptional regulator [Bacillus sp. SA1-12]